MVLLPGSIKYKWKKIPFRYRFFHYFSLLLSLPLLFNVIDNLTIDRIILSLETSEQIKQILGLIVFSGIVIIFYVVFHSGLIIFDIWVTEDNTMHFPLVVLYLTYYVLCAFVIFAF